MKSLTAILTPVAAVGLGLSSVFASSVIDQPLTDGAFQIEAYEPVGQSFTALDSHLLSIEFLFQTFNPGFPNTPIEMKVLDGEGVLGTELGSKTLNVPDGYSGYFLTDWSSSGIHLIPGNLYTVSFDASSPYFGLSGNSTDVYAGGKAFSNEGFAFRPADWTFRIAFQDGNNVPDAANTALLTVASLSVLGYLRRRLA